MYYECTYNGDKKELYLDTYKKQENQCIKVEDKIMTYYNPRVYNYSNLKEEDKAKVKCMWEMVEDLNDYKEQYLPYEGIPTIRKMKYEIEQETMENMIRYMYRYIGDYIIGCIESYDGDVEEVETSDYFYGLRGQINV